MYIKIIAIGTSKGIRLPKYLLDKYQLTDEVEVEDTGSGLMLKPAKTPRAGWQEAFKKVAEKSGEYRIDLPESDWDKEEWEW